MGNALKNLAKRLEGPFNIESVVDPIDVKISDAIMNLQENAPQVSSKIFAGCGTPRKARKKRDAAAPATDNANIYNFDFSNKQRARPTTAAGTSLDRLVRDINDKVKTAKDFWVQLPYIICNDEELAAQPSSEDDCWNGQDRAKYMPEVQKDGVINQINNPEVEVDVSKANTMFTRQIVQLRLITSRLQNAYNGEDVDWIDTDTFSRFQKLKVLAAVAVETMEAGSGSGSGYLTDEEEEGIVDIDKEYTFPNRNNNNNNNNPANPGGKPGRPGQTPGCETEFTDVLSAEK
nr:hypothetical protein BaRGS_021178 [Batillaria attramentaria]